MKTFITIEFEKIKLLWSLDLHGIGDISGEFFIYDRDKLVISKFGEQQLVESFLNENGGIRVYRDNIRVYNYGEPGDDWLGLDLRRVNVPGRHISRNIIVGSLDLSVEDSFDLQEKLIEKVLLKMRLMKDSNKLY
jgi:hypothetical protein